ncbi:MAG TPA: hypothetical protein VLT36_21930, partial [Candidatus Dormibacteraeota bacterium]|nr:hypothetical protein [Candidatus Dormibacteraeota bacterium]
FTQLQGRSVKPSSKDFDNVHPAPSPITIWWEQKRPASLVIVKLAGALRLVGIVGLETYFSTAVSPGKQGNSVVHRKLRKSDEVNNGLGAAGSVQETLSGPLLVRARQWKNHPPMAAQEIRTPATAAARFQQSFFSLAECAERRKSRNGYSLRLGTRATRAPR